MKNSNKIIIAVVAIIILIAVAVAIILTNSKPKTNLEPINNVDDLTALVEKVYEGIEIEMPMLITQAIDTTDNDFVKAITGLENGNDLEHIVKSEPMMSSQAYSLVLVKVKKGVNADKIAKDMNEGVDARKWICVTAEKVYSTSSGDVVCLVMSRDELAKPVFEEFKSLAGTVGEEYVRTEVETEIPMGEPVAGIEAL